MGNGDWLRIGLTYDFDTILYMKLARSDSAKTENETCVPPDSWWFSGKHILMKYGGMFDSGGELPTHDFTQVNE